MIYKDVINNNWNLILRKKKKYTIKDIGKVLEQLPELSQNQARFIVVCTAIFHDSEVQKKLYNAIHA